MGCASQLHQSFLHLTKQPFLDTGYPSTLWKFQQCSAIFDHVGTLHTGYPRVQVWDQGEGKDVLPHAAMCPTAPDPPPYWGGLRRYHMSHGSGPYLPVREGSGTATCPTAPDPTSLLGGLRRCHVSHSSGPRLSAGEGSDATTWPTTHWGSRTSRIKKITASPAAHLRLARSIGTRACKFPRCPRLCVI
jgi:hypothetical protein